MAKVKKVKIASLGKEIELKPIKWKQAKQIGLTSLLQKISTGEDVDFDEGIDKLLSLYLSEEEKDELEYSEVMDLFNSIVEQFAEKK